MAASGEGGAAQDEVGRVLRCSETQLAGGVAGGCTIHPAMATTLWLQCDQTLPLCTGCGLRD